MKSIQTAWKWIVEWFERGDLVPLLVIVSAVHYAAVLNGKDAPIVAVAIGLLVDLGHYRTVRAAVRYSGDWRQSAVRWMIAALMTALSLNYHQRFYADWWLSAPLPLLIASLAWLQWVDRNSGSRGKPESKPSQAGGQASEAKPEAKPPAYVCGVCGYIARSSHALDGHKAKHSRGKAKPEPAKANGRAKEMPVRGD